MVDGLSVLFLTRFTQLNAYTRYRVSQYVPFLERAGVRCVVDSLFPDSYITRTYAAVSRSRALLTLAPWMSVWLARRLWLLLHETSRFDVVCLQYEALPYFPLVCERLLFRSGRRVVVDFDDAISVNYEEHKNPVLRRLLRSKIAGIVSMSHSVTTANRHLAEWAMQHNSNVTTIPNSVDLKKYSFGARQPCEGRRPVIGWIGTPITAKYLRLLERPLRLLRQRHDFVLKVIGAPGFTMEGLDVRAVPWSEASEVGELRCCDIGVMPLPDDAWARGKSALKVIQYLAAGVAAVASPVGANADVLTDGQNGLLAATDEQWAAKLALLIEDRTYRDRLATAGRQTVEERFSLQANAPRLVKVLKLAATSPRGAERGALADV
jgi:glycosyltransferase involved in cell wall biosynthesis